MRLHARIDELRIGLREPVITARGPIFERSGHILVLRDQAGRWGRGELAPLPGWSEVTGVEALRQLEACADALTRGEAWLPAAEAPEVRAAVDAALQTLAAARAGLPLWQHLGGGQGQVTVNALVVGATPAALGRAAGAAVGEGYRTLKLKLGMGDDPTRASAVLSALDEAGAGEVLVRLDANGAWGVDHAVTALDELAALFGDRLEYVEDPVATPEELRGVRERSPVPVAADDLALSALDAVVADRLAEVVVVKPPLVGGITPTLELARRARASGIDVVVSSLYDGPVGLAAWCHLAAAIGGRRAHGLGTATLLADGSAEHLVARAGVIRL